MYPIKKLVGNIKSNRGRRFLIYMLLEKIQRLLPYPNLRVAFLKLLGANIADDAIIQEVIFQNPYVNGFRNLIMESKVTIQPGCIIDLADKVILREMCTVSQGVIIMTHSDPGYKLGKPLAKIYQPYHKPVEIGKGAWIGAGAIIFPGVKIREFSVIGAGAVVLNDIPSKSVAVGAPAKVIKTLRGVSNEICYKRRRY
jgi:acetyltransferase-like isoleucine patch superfamily enzyme